MLFLAILLMGSISFSRLKVSLFPDIVFPRLTVLTPYTDVAPEEIENLVTRPIEDAVSSVNGVKKIRSRSQEGLSIVEVTFDWGTSIDLATINLRQKVDLTKSILPQDSGKSIIVAFDPASDPVVVLVAKPTGSSFTETRDYIEKNIRPYLERITGVASIQILGGTRREIQVLADGPKLHGYEISLDMINSAIGANNFNFPAGNIKRGDKELTVRIMGEIQKVKDLDKIVVHVGESGTPVLLSQVAEVEDGFRERKGASIYNENEAVVVGIRKEPSSNTVETANNIRNSLEEINKRFGQNVQLEVIQDQSHYISSAISSVTSSAFQGGLLAFLILFFFLKDIRSALIVAVTTPVAVMATFIPMFLQNISINLMSLGGLSLGLGMLIDNSIVVLESILAVREKDASISPSQAAFIGTKNVIQSVTASTLTNAVVFLPIIFISGIAGEVFRDLALTVTFSSFASLFASLTLIPMLTAVPVKKGGQVDSTFRRINEAASPVFIFTEEILIRAKEHYTSALHYSLKNPARIITASLTTSALGILLFSFVETSLFPEVDQGVVVAEYDLKPGTSLSDSVEYHKRIHSFLSENGIALNAITNIGYDPDDTSSRVKGVRKPHHAESIYYVDKSRFTSKEAIKQIEDSLSQLSSIDMTFRVKGDALQELLGTSDGRFIINIEGRQRKDLRIMARRIVDAIKTEAPEFKVHSTALAEVPEIQLSLDRTSIAAAGLSPESVASVIRTAVQGTISSTFREPDTEVDIRLKLREGDRRNPGDLSRLFVETPQGGKVSLAPLVDIKDGLGHPTYLRHDQRSLEQILVSFPHGKQTWAREYLERLLSQIEKENSSYHSSENKPEASIELENQETIDSLMNLIFAFVLSSILIYMLLAAQFESLLHPLTLSLAIPMMFFGVSSALLITGHTLNITSATGLILLSGIVVNNALILYEFIQEKRVEGVGPIPLTAIIVESGRERLRPIILTSLTSIIGLLPLSLGFGEGSELQAPMAVVMIGGMTVSSLLTLIAFPTFFLVAETWRLEGKDSAMRLWKSGEK